MTAEARRLQENAARPGTGSAGGPTSASAPGARSARTTAPDGTAWDYFPHDHARSRAYRWNEDGLAGICDRHQRICFAAGAVERARPDPQGAAVRPDRQRGQPRRGRQGVLLLPRLHADALLHEDALQVSAGGVPLRATWSTRTGGAARSEPEYELLDTGVFDDDRYFDVFVEYAKADADDILIRITVDQPRARAGAARTCCRRSGSATPGPGAATRRGPSCARPRDRRQSASSRSTSRRYGTRWLLLRRRARAAVHRERDQHAHGCSATPNRARYVKDGINDCVVDGDGDGGEPGTTRHQGRGALRADVAPARRVDACGCGSRDGRADRRRPPFGADFDAIVRRAAGARPTSSTRRCIPPTLSDDAQRGAAPGARRPAVVEAVLPLRRDGLAGGRSGAAAAAAGAAATGATTSGRTSTTPTSSRCRTSGSTRGTPPGTWRSTACRWRSSIPSSPRTSSCCCCASGTCTPTASCRPTSGPSATSTRRCTPGRRWRVYKIEQKRTRHRRPRVPGARLPQAAAELHLVGQPQGRRGQQRLPGRLPRPRQHRRLRPQRAAADRRPPRAVRRHELDGDVLARTCWRSRWSWPRDDPAYEDVASKFCEHFLYIADAMNNLRRRRHRPVGRGGRVLLRRPAPAGRTRACRSRCARWSG